MKTKSRMNRPLMRRIIADIRKRPGSLRMWSVTHCIAGKACKLSKKLPDHECQGWTDLGRELLGLTERQAGSLFYVYRWGELYHDYNGARTRKAEAAVAIKAINKMMKHGRI